MQPNHNKSSKKCTFHFNIWFQYLQNMYNKSLQCLSHRARLFFPWLELVPNQVAEKEKKTSYNKLKWNLISLHVYRMIKTQDNEHSIWRSCIYLVWNINIQSGFAEGTQNVLSFSLNCFHIIGPPLAMVCIHQKPFCAHILTLA